MFKKISILLMAMTLLCSAAFAEIYTGSTVAGSLKTVKAAAGGILEEFELVEGKRVHKGEILGKTRENLVFAAENGTVSVINAEEGEELSGSVLELMPENHYSIYCTVSKAYQKAANTRIHVGEILYVRCTINGTHRAIGVVTGIDGDQFQLEVIGGELYIGEAVYLYREDDFESEDRVGAGTVTVTENRSMQIDGTLLELCVEEGEYVERGELLFTWAADEELRLIADEDGIVTELSAEKGDRLDAGQAVAQIAPFEDIQIEISVDETEVGYIGVGDSAVFVCASDPEEVQHSGTVCDIHGSAADGVYTVRIQPDAPLEYIGMHVEVTID